MSSSHKMFSFKRIHVNFDPFTDCWSKDEKTATSSRTKYFEAAAQALTNAAKTKPGLCYLDTPGFFDSAEVPAADHSCPTISLALRDDQIIEIRKENYIKKDAVITMENIVDIDPPINLFVKHHIDDPILKAIFTEDPKKFKLPNPLADLQGRKDNKADDLLPKALGGPR